MNGYNITILTKTTKLKTETKIYYFNAGKTLKKLRHHFFLDLIGNNLVKKPKEYTNCTITKKSKIQLLRVIG